ncbi:type 1 glutamine amidotransferase [Actinoplanes sp. KI2]|uniref:gamma-glutamyl-gamma-aminobutyrate hydrolase family protein n=1 Tax=Actinoplanes sp. KI2 TaxID=2983315 RepID=UPI0021D5C731|nr:type 1 glutamine amidotransferase [Actinoplanes sp. KI2]MCU7727949.1 type 1 glutamine amidotransferase [Actinoplanes sp. KI2]
MTARRPLIAIPARFSAHASALRFRAEVNAHKLVRAVYDAGGEPVTVHPRLPADDDEVRERLRFAGGVLLPGGGDLAAHWAGQQPHPGQYDVDEEQDAFDLAVARVALAGRIPLLAICRGLQVVNVARGGDLIQDLPAAHRMVHVVGELTVSCHHHQGIGRPGKGLRATAYAADGTIEALALDDALPPDERGGWFRGVQWHPEDTADTDPAQAALFEELIRAARSPRSW